jgi:hypothetical protein
MRAGVVVVLLIALFLFNGSSVPSSTAGSPLAQRLSLPDVVGWFHAGESEELIVGKLKKNNRPFDLSEDEKRELRREGVTETILKYLVEPSLPYNPPPPPPPQQQPPGPTAPAETYTPDPLSAKIPPDGGVYLAQKSELAPIGLKTLVAGGDSGVFSKIKRGVFFGGKTIGYLAGSASRVRVDSAMPAVFYVRLSGTAKIEDLALVSFQVQDQKRELEFSSNKAKDGKPAVKIESMRQFEMALVGPKLYRVAPAKLTTGEYFFYFIGSADPAKGVQGVGYDFGVN